MSLSEARRFWQETHVARAQIEKVHELAIRAAFPRNSIVHFKDNEGKLREGTVLRVYARDSTLKVYVAGAARPLYISASWIVEEPSDLAERAVA